MIVALLLAMALLIGAPWQALAFAPAAKHAELAASLGGSSEGCGECQETDVKEGQCEALCPIFAVEATARHVPGSPRSTVRMFPEGRSLAGHSPVPEPNPPNSSILA